MPVKPETNLYKRVRDNLRGCHITRIESRVGLGIPDCLIACKEGVFVMLELKVVKRGRKVNLSPHQIAFHLKHATDMGCPTFILVQHIPTGGMVKDSMLLLYGGDQVMELAKLGVDLQPIGQWSWGQPMWEVMRHQLLTS